MTARLKHRVLAVITLVLCLLQLSLVPLSHWIGIDRTGVPNVPGYLEKPNWNLQFVFFVVLGWLVATTWSTYQEVWDKLPTRAVLYRGNVIEKDAASLLPIKSRLDSVRPWLAVISIMLGLILTSIDAGCLWNEYQITHSSRSCTELDFTVAFRLGQFPHAYGHRVANGIFVAIAYLLQGALISYGWLALLQLCVQSYVFARFERLSFSRSLNLTIKLNYRDALGE